MDATEMSAVEAADAKRINSDFFTSAELKKMKSLDLIDQHLADSGLKATDIANGIKRERGKLLSEVMLRLQDEVRNLVGQYGGIL